MENIVSIIILAYNKVALSKKCLAHIEKNTDHPFELIVVDNASTDETKTYFERVRINNKFFRSKTCIFNDTNIGFVKGVNNAIKICKHDYILLLNNDCFVPNKWLSQLMGVFVLDKTAGIVGPFTNRTGPGNFDQLINIEIFKKGMKGKLTETHRYTDFLLGHCMLIKKEVITKIGLFDESFGMGNFEDLDFCLRAKHAGFKLVIASNVFVIHLCHSSFNKTQLNKLLERNKKIFYKKWSNTKKVL